MEHHITCYFWRVHMLLHIRAYLMRSSRGTGRKSKNNIFCHYMHLAVHFNLRYFLPQKICMSADELQDAHSSAFSCIVSLCSIIILAFHMCTLKNYSDGFGGAAFSYFPNNQMQCNRIMMICSIKWSLPKNVRPGFCVQTHLYFEV